MTWRLGGWGSYSKPGKRGGGVVTACPCAPKQGGQPNEVSTVTAVGGQEGRECGYIRTHSVAARWQPRPRVPRSGRAPGAPCR